MYLSKDRGFTLVELTIVILVIGILAAIAAPKFINMADSAKIASDEAVIAALKSAINIQTSANIVNGTTYSYQDGSTYYYPQDNPFTFLSQSPQFIEHTVSTDIVDPDGVHWHVMRWAAPYYVWNIDCPHFWGTVSTSAKYRGRSYVYLYGPGEAQYPGHKTGDIWLWWNAPGE